MPYHFLEIYEIDDAVEVMDEKITEWITRALAFGDSMINRGWIKDYPHKESIPTNLKTLVWAIKAFGRAEKYHQNYKKTSNELITRLLSNGYSKSRCFHYKIQKWPWKRKNDFYMRAQALVFEAVTDYLVQLSTDD